MAVPPLIGVGASAGGVEALTELVAGLDTDLPATMLIVLHQPAAAPTVLPEILARRCVLEVLPARSGDVLRAGRVHVSIPDRHLQVSNGRILTTREPKENGHRPGVDPMFRSLVSEAGPRAIGVVLSGLLDDGAAGLLEIVRHGGGAVVQDLGQALHEGMPRSALARVPGAVVRPASEIGAVLREMVTRVPPAGHRSSSELRYGVTDAEQDPRGPPAGPACPYCDGPLFHVGTGEHPRHRCRVGHTGSPESLGAAHVATNARAAMRGALGDAAVVRRLLTGGSPPPDACHTDESGDEGR